MVLQICFSVTRVYHILYAIFHRTPVLFCQSNQQLKVNISNDKKKRQLGEARFISDNCIPKVCDRYLSTTTEEMGKAGKDRKRRRLLDAAVFTVDPDEDIEDEEEILDENNIKSTIKTLTALSHNIALFRSTEYKSFRAVIQPLVQEQADKHFEKRAILAMSDTELTNALNKNSITIAVSVLSTLRSDLDLFRTKEYKLLRTALHPLVLELTNANKKNDKNQPMNQPIQGGYSGRISAHFMANAWLDALHELHAMRKAKQSPKLGALQRWVRDADLAPVELRFPLIEAVLRVVMLASTSSSAASNEVDVEEKDIVMHQQPVTMPLFHIFPNRSSSSTPAPTPENYSDVIPKENIKIVQSVEAKDRPSNTDLNMYALTKGTFILDNSVDVLQSRPVPDRVDVPGVPGGFVMRNILSNDECDHWLNIAHMMKFAPDAVVGINHVLWLAEDKLVDSLFQRVKSLLPSEIDHCALTGINARLRFFRYEAGAEYRIHIDGAWPGSGFDADNNPVEDFYKDRYSRLTFLIYLNDDFDGGYTTFFTPRPNEVSISSMLSEQSQ